ncbi:MAG: hypothetical protein L0H24_11940, partial [Microlunatus sp.]|nr:hypothetical protein [Microlunatus sp.]
AGADTTYDQATGTEATYTESDYTQSDHTETSDTTTDGGGSTEPTYTDSAAGEQASVEPQAGGDEWAAGTDAGGQLPHGLVAQEIAALAPILGAEGALAAGSWAARSWLGHPAELTDGAPADLVVLDADPRIDLATLRAPRFVVLRGRVVEAA